MFNYLMIYFNFYFFMLKFIYILQRERFKNVIFNKNFMFIYEWLFFKD